MRPTAPIANTSDRSPNRTAPENANIPAHRAAVSSTPFRVRHLSHFIEAAQNWHVDVLALPHGHVTVTATDPDNPYGWPTGPDNDRDWIYRQIAPHLPDGEVAIFFHAHIYFDFIERGTAVAINHTGDLERVDLNDTYERALHL
jgi:hypothetical protein